MDSTLAPVAITITTKRMHACMAMRMHSGRASAPQYCPGVNNGRTWVCCGGKPLHDGQFAGCTACTPWGQGGSPTSTQRAHTAHQAALSEQPIPSHPGTGTGGTGTGMPRLSTTSNASSASASHTGPVSAEQERIEEERQMQLALQASYCKTLLGL